MYVFRVSVQYLDGKVGNLISFKNGNNSIHIHVIPPGKMRVCIAIRIFQVPGERGSVGIQMYADYWHCLQTSSSPA